METKDTEYKEGNGEDFKHFLFSKPPQEKNSIKLQLDDPTIKIALHIFQELLMILTDGMKYLYGDDGGVNITRLTAENIKEINRYFESMGFNVFTESFTIAEYLSNMKLPNYFVNKDLITDQTPLHDIYYETYVGDRIYRIYFDFCR